MAIAAQELEQDTSRYCLASIFNKIFAPEDASVIMISTEGGTGKTFAAAELAHYLADKMGYYVLTNILFSKRVKSGNGWKSVNPHERVKTVNTLKDFWIEYAQIKKQDPFAYVVPMLDEWHKWVDRVKWYEDMPLYFKDWWGENRKYRTAPVMITQKMRMIPSRLLMYVRWYITKSRSITSEYNRAYGCDYSYKDLAFIIPIREEDELEKQREHNFTLDKVAEVLVLERGADRWTGDPNRAKLGQVCYVSESSASFTFGKVGGKEDWFPRFLMHISACHPSELADKIIEYFDKGGSTDSELSVRERLELAAQIYRLNHGSNISEHGWPVVRLTIPGRRKMELVELSPANLSRIFKVHENSLRKKIGGIADA